MTILANPRLTMFGANIWLIVGALILGTFLLFVLIGAWTAIRVALFRRQQRRAEQAYRDRRYDADGHRLPPATRGICDVCKEAHVSVYHLADGRRVCPADYQRQMVATRPAD